MKHISNMLSTILENTSKAKFYHGNRDIFLKYFDNARQYDALILAGNFKKLELIIKEGK